jgi:hypothetical protein
MMVRWKNIAASVAKATPRSETRMPVLRRGCNNWIQHAGRAQE